MNTQNSKAMMDDPDNMKSPDQQQFYYSNRGKVPMKLSSGIVGEVPREVISKDYETKNNMNSMLMKNLRNDVGGGSY